ncbi:MAG TPA: isocitrate lyase/phosphoenolpyruvate mutase family protein [Solirubrobacter sp.]|nr:isocitrate lyase/phosphoenolpyruvate mutase family protein [Solirubrobacter sp.]
MRSVDEKQRAFVALHRPGAPFLLPNAWDHASAAAFARAGFEAVGTTSLGVAAALGVPDGHAATAEATVELARRLTHLPTPVTIDIENGFSTDPAAVADYVDRLGDVAGVNVEDQLADPTTFAATIAALSTKPVFVNARVDTYWLGRPDLAETLERARRYEAAGADGIFVPGVTDPHDIEALATALDAPLNVLLTHPLDTLAACGVARVSTGSLLYRAALKAALDAATTGGRDVSALDYATVDGLAAPPPPGT